MQVKNGFAKISLYGFSQEEYTKLTSPINRVTLQIEGPNFKHSKIKSGEFYLNKNKFLVKDGETWAEKLPHMRFQLSQFSLMPILNETVPPLIAKAATDSPSEYASKLEFQRSFQQLSTIEADKLKPIIKLFKFPGGDKTALRSLASPKAKKNP
jgi:hypothetical protein